MAEGSRLAIFRADASVAIGGGHILRCLVLADALAHEGWNCMFMASAESSSVVPAVTQYQTTVLNHREFSDPAVMLRYQANGCSLLTIDHYDLGMAYEKQLRGWANRILVIDDLANRLHHCDFLLDQTQGRSETDYDKLVPTGCRFLLGTDYALLRPEFSRLRPRALALRPTKIGVKRILISFGATDQTNETLLALNAVDLCKIDVVVDVALGAAAPHLNEVRRRAAMMSNVQVHVQTDRMAELMLDADLAIGAAGVSSYERCCLGLPTILVQVAENQRNIAQNLTAAGAAIYVGATGKVTEATMASAITRLMSSVPELRRMAERAAALADGFGSARAIKALLSEYVTASVR